MRGAYVSIWRLLWRPVALCVTATRGTSVGAADVPVVPAKGDVTIRLNWWGGDARIKAMIAELQESIDFNS